MNDIIEDIEVLQNAIIAFTEGASDEKRTALHSFCLLYTSPSPRDLAVSRMPSSA